VGQGCQQVQISVNTTKRLRLTNLPEVLVLADHVRVNWIWANLC